MMEGVSKRRKLSHASTEKHTQMLYKVAAYSGERGQSLERSDNKTLSELSERVFKKNKHVGVAVRALQEPRGGVGKRKRGPPAGRIRCASSATAGRRPVAPTEADAPLIERIIEEVVNTKHWASPTVLHHRTMLRKLSNSLRVRGRPLLERAMPPCPNLSNKSFRRTGGALDEDAFVAQSMFPLGT